MASKQQKVSPIEDILQNPLPFLIFTEKDASSHDDNVSKEALGILYQIKSPDSLLKLTERAWAMGLKNTARLIGPVLHEKLPRGDKSNLSILQRILKLQGKELDETKGKIFLEAILSKGLREEDRNVLAELAMEELQAGSSLVEILEANGALSYLSREIINRRDPLENIILALQIWRKNDPTRIREALNSQTKFSDLMGLKYAINATGKGLLENSELYSRGSEITTFVNTEVFGEIRNLFNSLISSEDKNEKIKDLKDLRHLIYAFIAKDMVINMKDLDDFDMLTKTEMLHFVMRSPYLWSIAAEKLRGMEHSSSRWMDSIKTFKTFIYTERGEFIAELIELFSKSKDSPKKIIQILKKDFFTHQREEKYLVDLVRNNCGTDLSAMIEMVNLAIEEKQGTIARIVAKAILSRATFKQFPFYISVFCFLSLRDEENRGEIGETTNLIADLIELEQDELNLLDAYIKNKPFAGKEWLVINLLYKIEGKLKKTRETILREYERTEDPELLKILLRIKKTV